MKDFIRRCEININDLLAEVNEWKQICGYTDEYYEDEGYTSQDLVNFAVALQDHLPHRLDNLRDQMADLYDLMAADIRELECRETEENETSFREEVSEQAYLMSLRI
jgi:hypothetical protein